MAIPALVGKIVIGAMIAKSVVGAVIIAPLVIKYIKENKKRD